MPKRNARQSVHNIIQITFPYVSFHLKNEYKILIEQNLSKMLLETFMEISRVTTKFAKNFLRISKNKRRKNENVSIHVRIFDSKHNAKNDIPC